MPPDQNDISPPHNKDIHRTLTHPHTVTGHSLFLAKHTTLTIHPAPPNTGIQFQRTDLPGKPLIPASIHNTLPATRHTVIALNPSAVTPQDLHPVTALRSTQPIVHTTEHVLSALSAMGITDAIITLDSPETPIQDGSAHPFLPPLLTTTSSQPRTQTPIQITTPIILTFDANTRIEAHPPAQDQPANTTRYEYHLSYPNYQSPNQHPCPIPPQSVSIDIPLPPLPPFPRSDSPSTNSHPTHHNPTSTPIQTQQSPENSFPGTDPTNSALPHQHLTDYRTEVAPARTFSFEHEAQAARAMGLFQHLTPKDMLVIGPQGPIQNNYRFPNEPARHKLLDLIGDLALTQRPIQGHIIAIRTGHAQNQALAKALTTPPTPPNNPS